MHDAIVVGARCAGSSVAMLLARKGWSVLLVDKNTFPSDTLSTHFIHPTGIARLKCWGLLDEVIASNAPRIDKWKFDMGHAIFTGSPPPVDGVAESYCPRRTVLDEILVRAAQRAGAEVREGFTAREILVENGRVTGIRGETRGGSTVTEQAPIVIGADGRNSLVARAVGAPFYEERPVLCCAYYTYWTDVPVDACEIYVRDRRLVLAFPTNDGLVCTFLEWPRDEYETIRSDVEGSVQRSLDLAPALSARIRRGRRVGRFFGTPELPNYFRKAYGPGWALAGDAGHHRDPGGGFGISDAFRDADQLVEALDRWRSRGGPLDAALAGYEEARNRVAMPTYHFNCEMASLQPAPPHVRALHGALAESQADADRFTGVVLGTVPVQDFFAPENIERIVTLRRGEARSAAAVGQGV